MLKNILYVLGFVFVAVALFVGIFLAQGGDFSKLFTPEPPSGIIVPPGAPEVMTPSGRLPEITPVMTAAADTLAVGASTEVTVSLQGPLPAMSGITLNIEYDPEVLEIGNIGQTANFRSYTYTGISSELKIITIVAGGYQGDSTSETILTSFPITRLSEGPAILRVNGYIPDNPDVIHSTFVDLAENILAVEPAVLSID